VTLAQRITNHHNAASDHITVAQVRLGHLLEKRSILSTVSVSDKVRLDSKHTPENIPYKLTSGWFGPLEVVAMQGAQMTVDLPETFGKAHQRVNICCQCTDAHGATRILGGMEGL